MEESEKEEIARRIYQETQDRERKLEKKQTLERKLNMEKILKKGKRRGKCKTSGQNMRRKTETCLHDECILAIHVAFNCSNIKTVINAQYTEYEVLDEFVLISSNRRPFEQGGS